MSVRAGRGVGRVLALVIVLGSAAPPVHAQEPAPAATEEPATAEARDHFRRGVELFQEGAYRGALAEFERAYAIAPNYRILYNIAQTRLQLQDYLGATQGYERYLVEGGAEIEAARRSEVESALSAMRERVGRLAIQVSRTGAEVFVDDVKVGVTPLAPTIPVNVGEHRIHALTEDGAEATQVVLIAGGDTVDVKLELKAPAPKTITVGPARPETLSTKQKVMIVSGSIGIGALLAAGATGFLAKGKADDLDKALDARPSNEKKIASLRDSTQRLALTTDILAGVALAGVATGIVLWLVGDDDEKKAEPKVALGVGPASLSVNGRF
jgi:hypothetical protein